MHQATAHFCRMVAADSRVRVQLFGAVARISVDRGRAELEPFICANRSRTCLTVHLAVNYDASHAPSDIPPVDLVIRTGDRHRLSHFVVSRCGDAELLFLQKLWPDFDRFDWDHALAWFASRERTQGE